MHPSTPAIVKIDKSFEDLDVSEQFDVVVMCHVLEHVFSPMSFLRKAYSILNKQGIVFVEVPFELYTPIIFKTSWRLATCRLLFYNCVRNFLLQAGFEPLSV